MDVDAIIRVSLLLSVVYAVVVALAAWVIKKLRLVARPVVRGVGPTILQSAGYLGAIGGAVLAIYRQAVEFSLLQAIGGGVICLAGFVAGAVGKICGDLINAEKAAVAVKPDDPGPSA